jgi:ABC-type dipeptide/oligopeptide/nickel transport system permease subunit
VVETSDAAVGARPTSTPGSTPVRAQLPKPQRGARFMEGLKRFVTTQPVGVVAAAGIIILLLAALFAPWIAPHDPVEQNRQAFMEGPSSQFWFGTDDLGRDIFSRIIHGARISLYVSTLVTLGSMVIGSALGIMSGYFKGWVDTVLQRFVDAIMAVPTLILALFIAALLGPSTRNVVLALVIVLVPRFSRISRGEMLRIRGEDYVDAARALGASPWRIMIRHGLPNMLPPIIVVASLNFGIAIIAEASLSFLGIGTPPPNPSWGLMLSQASRFMEIAPWMVIFPGLVLSLSVLAFNLFGDALRDFLDPKLVR